MIAKVFAQHDGNGRGSLVPDTNGGWLDVSNLQGVPGRSGKVMHDDVQSVILPGGSYMDLMDWGSNSKPEGRTVVYNTGTQDRTVNVRDVLNNLGLHTEDNADMVSFGPMPDRRGCCFGDTNSNCAGWGDLSVNGPVCTQDLMTTWCSAGGDKPVLATDAKCRTWCQNNPQACDASKTTYCINNPGSTFCRCIYGGQQPDYVALMKRDTQGVLSSAPASCFPQSTCPSGMDLVDTLKTTNIQNTKCPDLQASIQNIMAGGNLSINNSTINSSATLQSANNAPTTPTAGTTGSTYIPAYTSAPTPAATNTPAPVSTRSTRTIWLVFLLIVAFAILMALLFLQDKTESHP